MPTKQYVKITKQIEKLQAEADQIRAAAIKDVIAQIRALMDEHDIGIDDLRAATRRGRGRPRKAAPAATRGGKRKSAGRPRRAKAVVRAKARPKYRSTADRKLTWTGRGRTPAWVKAWVNGGGKLDDLLISRK